MELWAVKVTSLTLMLISTLVLGLAPVWLIKRSQRNARFGGSTFQRVMSYLNCVVGGIFLGTTMLHLLPEVKEQIDDVLADYKIDTHFAVAEFVVSIGFFIVMLLEHVIMSLQHHHNDVPLQDQPDTQANGNASYGTMQPDGADSQHDHKTDETTALISNNGRNGHQVRKRSSSVGDIDQPIVYRDSDCVHVIHPSHHEHHHIQEGQLAGVRSFILLLAMSLHTVFEGLAIGLQQTTQDTWNLFIAIIAHKVVIAFSLGVQFTGNLQHTRRAVLFVVLFAVMSPLGIAIGTLVTEFSTKGEVGSATANAILQALATGTFIYVAFFEVLIKEVGQDHGVLKVFAVILGYTVMTLLNLFNGEPEHD